MDKRDFNTTGTNQAQTVRPVSYAGSKRSLPGGRSSRAALPAASGASAYSRNAYQIPRKRRGKGFIVAIVAMALVLVAGGTAFGGYMYVNSISDKMHEGVDDELKAVLSEEKVAAGDPFYMLIIGTDGSEERVASGDYGDTFRSDSMILTRVDPQQKNVSLVSIERDTYVNIDGYGPNKLNAAATFGGAALTVDTVSEFAGVPISHYVAIDFDGFKAAVDALGGIEVDVPMTIDDEDAGGYVAAGPQTLDGDQALILCRARHAYDEYGSGDYYRMANQRMVMGAIAEKLLASDPVTMANTINSMADYITTDFNVEDIISIATQMRGMDIENDIYSAMNPTYGQQIDGIWYEICNLTEWKDMMARVDKGLPPYADDDRNKNDGGGLDGTVTGIQEMGVENAELSPAASEEDGVDEDAAGEDAAADDAASSGEAL